MSLKVKEFDCEDLDDNWILNKNLTLKKNSSSNQKEINKLVYNEYSSFNSESNDDDDDDDYNTSNYYNR